MYLTIKNCSSIVNNNGVNNNSPNSRPIGASLIYIAIAFLSILSSDGT